ncbi:acetolactate synthase large subunit [Antarcticimicrobium sediminis]|uniref:Acetolactate synthase large subunit n=2 Tax=Antarcticimicrobium sediminis TaxID=2546227 RepID=A0A4R5F1E7_9RHOB|nr:acetolactate synthase large subunit [Antarcticimicrobium sediminis]
MNGAESLVRSLLASDVEVCFTNPGTSEMHFVAALDHVPGMRSVLALFEGVATGAADGYWRMARKPASTLLHLGPGLANGLANLHNAKKAGSGVVNIVGEHAASHVALDAPLTSDIEGIARPVSHWVRSSSSAVDVGFDAARAVRAARTAPGQVATLILPGDTAWSMGGAVAEALAPHAQPRLDTGLVDQAAQALDGPDSLLLLGGSAMSAQTLELAGQIAAKTGCTLMSEWASARAERGAGRVAMAKVPYPIDLALETLAPYRRIVLVGARAPIGFFAYPGKPARLTHPEAEILELAGAASDLTATLDALVQATGAGGSVAHLAKADLPDLPPLGPLTPDSLAPLIARAIPENAIVVDESITSGRGLGAATTGAAPHSWLNNCGGSIGYGLPVSIGAAIARPDRKVLALISDGSAMYTLQALWTLAREGLDVTVVIFANRSYNILRGELSNVGVQNPGPRAIDMLSLDRPTLGWVDMARGMGVEASRVEDTAAFALALEAGLSTPGPVLIEAVM